MRLFYISSSQFKGSIELLYDESGKLMLFDLRGAKDVTPAGINQLMTAVIPVFVTNIENRFKGLALTLVESEFTVSLDDFKQEYPYSRNMHLLPHEWDKMSKTNQVLAWKAAIEYRGYCQRNTWYKPMIAATWLKKQEYLNDWKKL
ncbi:hypothetical protein F0L74_06010 [Chitinophaga agrisoli]|uniref:Uncharacterized protein n=1 Tax=Chitinophaga agrisoli TaxID=2607653 RepID=A0A5B2W1H5_9BACT|nr:hypothetical protein [Chitinophaga agrisoli]KAA2245511.1 hypothetical protein F0L74_06010 [Chitinophaga agrisoli]